MAVPQISGLEGTPAVEDREVGNRNEATNQASSPLFARLLDALHSPISGRQLNLREALLSTALIVALAAGVYASHVARGGWYLDDWINVALMDRTSDLAGAFDEMSNITYRVGLSASLAALHVIGGDSPSTYLMMGVLLTAIQGSLFYLVLRQLRLNALVAGVAAAIFVVLPCIDATRLWATATPIQIAGSLYLLGVSAAIHGLGQRSRPRRIAWHAGAVLLFVLAILSYELVVGLVLVTFLLYATTASGRATGKRLVADWAGAAAALAYIVPRASEDRGAESSVAFLWDRAVQMWTPTEEVFRSLLPWSDVLGGSLGLVIFALGTVGAGLAIRQNGATGAGFRAWLALAGISAVFALAGLVMLLPADPYFIPRVSGLGNRVSAFAAFGAVLLLIALITIACGGMGVLLRRPRVGLAAALALLAATTITLTNRELNQQDAWARSWDEQISVLSSINVALDGDVGETTAVVTFNHTTFLLPADVSVFAYSWDLRGALMQIFGTYETMAHPWVQGARCAPAGIVFPDGVGGPNGAVPYGYGEDLKFIDVPASTATAIRSRRACESSVIQLTGTPPPR